MQQEQTVQLLFHSEVHRTAAARLYMSVLQLLSLPLIIYYYVCVCVGGGGGGGGGGGILLAVFSFPWKCIGPYAYCTAYIVQHCWICGAIWTVAGVWGLVGVAVRNATAC